MSNDYQCPECGSSLIDISYPNITCLACHRSESLIDYSVSWNTHRANCLYYHRPDPGPSEPLPTAPLPKEIDDRLAKIEERLDSQRPATAQGAYELKHLVTKLTERVNKEKQYGKKRFI